MNWLVLKRLADNTEDESLATSLRRKRFAVFLQLMSSVEKPLRLLDVGGTQRFWETMQFAEERGISITLLNIVPVPISRPNFESVVGDARNMRQYGDREFDVVFSNSVIEHVGSFENQERMAKEIQRVGQRYFVQTPNKYFPLEPHFLLPFFQFLPVSLRAWMLSRSDIGWWKRIPDYPAAKAEIESIQLLTRRKLQHLFPDAVLADERVLGLVKSFVVYNGWGG